MAAVHNLNNGEPVPQNGHKLYVVVNGQVMKRADDGSLSRVKQQNKPITQKCDTYRKAAPVNRAATQTSVGESNTPSSSHLAAGNS